MIKTRSLGGGHSGLFTSSFAPFGKRENQDKAEK